MKMKKISSIAKYLLLLILCISINKNTSAQPSNARWEYIQRFKDIAVKEKDRAGIPASIKLAQGILESGAGTSTLAKEAKNHFGMKCGSEWRGDTYYLKDDDYDENGVLKESCFRVFRTAEESYIAHSEFLRDPNKAYRYGFLFRLEPTDYKKWAKGLTSAGYATSPTYADALIGIIDQYKLYIYDTGSGGDPTLVDIILINDVKMTLAKAGQTPAELAQRYKVKLKCLLAFNEELKGPNQPLDVNQHIFLQKKRRFFRGGQKEHYVKPGETMFSISQIYGVRLKSLRRKNKINIGQEPAYGEKLHLRGWSWFHTAPKLRDANFVPPPSSNPFDEGTGKIPHIDETNNVDPDELKPQGNIPNNGNTNNGNSGSTTSNGGNSTSTPTGGNTTNNTTPVKPDTKNQQGNTGTTTVPTTKPTTGSTGTGTGTTIPTTKPNTPTTTNGSTTKPNSTTKPENQGTDIKPKPSTKPIEPKPSTPTTPDVQYHTVEKGETLYSISKRYGLTVDNLKKLNNLTDNNIGLGQKLRLN
jgi:LysM repeat protein